VPFTKKDENLPSADIHAIKRMIPHRYPFLLVDRVINIKDGESCIGIKNVTAGEPFFEGHFPTRPVMPGVLVVEAMAQAAAVLVVKTLDAADVNLLVYFMTVDNCKFRRMVEPGDQLELHVSVVRHRGQVWKFRGEARVEGELAAEADYSAMIATPEEAESKGK
jgi:3-hydroxyacyl-[acyl-carrier-protein] dehydratase